MAQTLIDKMRLKDGGTIVLIDPPEGYAETLLALGPGIRIVSPAEEHSQIHWFVRRMDDLRTGLTRIEEGLQSSHLLWLFYPKGTSGMQTDLNRDSLWQLLQPNERLQFLVLISVDEIWSAFSIRRKTHTDTKKALKPEPREIYAFADSATKTIKLPDDLTVAFKGNSAAHAKFELLPFSHRREYVEWIVTAKKPETRARRVEGMLEMLLADKKSPREAR